MPMDCTQRRLPGPATPTSTSVHAVATAAAPTALSASDGVRTGKRRRLWQLPTQAHELLLAMSFSPDGLRREAARTLGQVHRRSCVLQGRDVDVLYGLVRDMIKRNPLSEAMQRRLDARHALAIRQMAALRDVDALQAAWASALVEDSVPSAMWALLTHPLGEVIESDVLYDTRQWVFAHARRSVGLKQAKRQTEARDDDARQRAALLQARLTAQQQQAAEALGLAQAEVMRLQIELARVRAVQASQMPQMPQMPPRPRTPQTSQTQPLTQVPQVPQSLVVSNAPPVADAYRNGRRNDPPKAKVGIRAPDRVSGSAAAPAPAAAPPGVLRQPVAVAGRQVLCVGGIQHAVARYRGRIEKLGGRFEHHDGGLEDSVHALDARLNRADLVICQAACLNHDAYHRVKRHCERTGTPCVYLDRPSLSRLDRVLAPERGTFATA